MEGAGSLTVDDKYWQIRAKAVERSPNYWLLHRRLIIITI